MPPHERGIDVRHFPVAEEDAAYEDHEDVVQEVAICCSFVHSDEFGEG